MPNITPRRRQKKIEGTEVVFPYTQKLLFKCKSLEKKLGKIQKVDFIEHLNSF